MRTRRPRWRGGSPTRRGDGPIDWPERLAALRAWREGRLEHLRSPRGPWSWAGLDFIGDRPARLGSGEACEIRLPERCPELVATLERTAEGVLVTPAAGAALTVDGRAMDGARVLAGDVELVVGDVVSAGHDAGRAVPGAGSADAGSAGPDAGSPDPDAVAVALLRRGARVAVRTFDPRAAASRDPAELAWFEPGEGWVASARVERPEGDERIPVVNVLGDVREVPVAARLHVGLGGGTWSLLAVDEGRRWFVNFRDGTNGVTTYGAGRFLSVEPVAGDRAVLDFNRAYHPPCAHTPHATCPLPPVPNRIGVPVEAGERTALQGWPLPRAR